MRKLTTITYLLFLTFSAFGQVDSTWNVVLKLTRIDLTEGDFEISQQIMVDIEKANFVLADFTLSPHNVYFEVGFARGVKKPIIQTAKKGTQLQFDVRNWKTLFYRNATELEETLIPKLKDIYKTLTT